MEGYFKTHRKLFESWVFADEKALKIWIWLIGKARHKPGFIPLQIGKGKITIELKRGQLIFGRNRAVEKLHLSGSFIYRKLKEFAEKDMISIKTNNQYSIITILNYDTYQYEHPESEQPMNNQRTTNEQPMNNQRTAREQHVNTNNNDKNGKNEYNEIINTSPDYYFKLYQILCLNLPKAKKLTNDRKTKIKSTLKDFSETEIKAAMSKANESEFCQGKNERGWKADFDFIFKTSSITKILEGKYDNRINTQSKIKLTGGVRKKR